MSFNCTWVVHHICAHKHEEQADSAHIHRHAAGDADDWMKSLDSSLAAAPVGDCLVVSSEPPFASALLPQLEQPAMTYSCATHTLPHACTS